MKHLYKLLLSASILLMTACADYLDIVPDDIPTIDKSFNNRTSAERFFFTCYSYLPNPVNVWGNPAMFGGDEMWWNIDQPNFANNVATFIAKGDQNSNTPYLNYWDGDSNVKSLFIGIRDCNIFLENIDRVQDLDEYERHQWVAEVKFLKAYYHYYLMQLYGPVPIIDENLPVSASPDEVRLYREPVDVVVDYIVGLIDEAMEDLPLQIMDMTNEAGRITQPIALSIKAKALVWAASPLFNGNGDYANFVDNQGCRLVDTEYKAEKWERAAKAIKNAIDTCLLAGHDLYKYIPTRQMSDTTAQKLTIRNAITEKWNKEIIWGSTYDVTDIQKRCMCRLVSNNLSNGSSEYCATLKIAEQYYTNNGIPINEDPDWNYENRYAVQKANEKDKLYIETGQETAVLNFNREPRFYAGLAFDRSVFEGSGKTTDNDRWHIHARKSEVSGFRSVGEHIPTGYFIKKLISYETVTGTTSGTFNAKRYSFPVVRLADLYLLYAEALNEMKNVPDAEVYKYIDLVRERAGLKGVVESWLKSSYANKPSTQAGMREIIHQERLIELAFEGQRFWDIRRWKEAMKLLNEPVQGWNYQGEGLDSYYTVTTYWAKRVFSTRDYLWPLKTETITINSNLVQNPGWE